MTPAPERPDLRARIEALHPDGQPCVCVAAVLDMLDEIGPVGGSHWDSNGAAAPVTDAGLRDGPWQQLSDEATPGPWAATTTPGFVTGHLTANGRNIADMRYRNGHADAALIVAAVNYVRDILSRQAEKETA
jgi:hypothetical protein